MKARNGRCLPACMIAMTLSLASPSLVGSAHAATFTVNDAGDASDATPGDGTCATAGAVCTLRAAIDEANALAGADDIDLSGVAGRTIALSDELTSVTTAMTIAGVEGDRTIIDGGSRLRPFFVDADATFRDLVIRNGLAQGGNGGGSVWGGGGGGAGGMGGGVFVQSGTVVFERVAFRGNTARGGDGGGNAVLYDLCHVENEPSIYGAEGGGGGGGTAGNGEDSPGCDFSGPGGPGGALGLEGRGGFGAGSGMASEDGNTIYYQGPGEVAEDGGVFGGGGGGGIMQIGAGLTPPNAGVVYPAGAGGFGGGGGGGGGGSSDGSPNAPGASGGAFGGAGTTGRAGGGGGGGGAGLGGAIFIRSGSVLFENCSFTGNTAARGFGQWLDNPGNRGADGQGKGGAIFVHVPGGASAIDLGGLDFMNNVADDDTATASDNDNVYGTSIAPVSVSDIAID